MTDIEHTPGVAWCSPSLPPASTAAASPCEPGTQKPALPIAQWMGQIYEAAPPAERSRLLAHLLRPLSLLSLAAVANGVFATFQFGNGWSELQVRLEDVQKVCAKDVIALVDYVQQVSVETVEAITRTFMASPLLTSSAAVLLLSMLVQQTQAYRAGDSEAGD